MTTPQNDESNRCRCWQLVEVDAVYPHGGQAGVGCPCSTEQSANEHLANIRRMGDTRNLIVVPLY